MLDEHNKPRPWYYIITYLWCIYVDIFFWFWVGVAVHGLWGTKRHWTAGCLCIEVREGSWPTRSWYRHWLGSTLGHTILYSPGRAGILGIVDTPVERHEMIHVSQFEALQLMAAIVFSYLVFSSGFQWQYLAILPSGAGLAYLASMLQAFLRGETPYRGSIFEDHAYAVED
jgi:hypothetical protein